jgi:hypothetical protein
MSNDLRKQIGYWFFLIMGMMGIVIFTFDFATTENYSFLEWLGISSAFSVFVFRPMVLLDIFEIIKTKLSK